MVSEIKWEPIEETNGKYLVSNTGIIKNRHSRYLKHLIFSDGRHRIHIGGKMQYYTLVDKLVAEYFVRNPNGYSNVIHIDGDQSNNCASNLKWVGRLKLNDEFYFHLHKVEKNYGSIANAPADDLNVITVKELAGSNK